MDGPIRLGCFYVTRNKTVVCIYVMVPEDEQPYTGITVRGSLRYDYYPDGRYDEEGRSDNCLDRQVQPDSWGRFHEMSCHQHVCMCGPGGVEGI